MTCLSQSHIYLPCWGQVSNLCTELTSQVVKLASSFWGSPDPARGEPGLQGATTQPNTCVYAGYLNSCPHILSLSHPLSHKVFFSKVPSTLFQDLYIATIWGWDEPKGTFSAEYMHIEREAPSFTCGHLSTSDTQDQTRPFSKQPMIMLPLFCWVWRLLYCTAARLTQKEEQEEVCLQPYLRMPGEEKPTLDGPFNHSGLSVQINSSADSPPKTNWAPQQPGP